MPTLISELTPLQSQWLYENQLTRGDSYEEKWHRFDPSFDTTIFRSKPHKRKLPYEDDHVTKSRRSSSPVPAAHQQQQHRHVPKPVNHGPRFPHTGEKLTWAQSRENLKVYYDHYGVRDWQLVKRCSLSCVGIQITLHKWSLRIGNRCNEVIPHSPLRRPSSLELQCPSKVQGQSQAWSVGEQATEKEKESCKVWRIDKGANR
jgi:hypothetical protein